MEPRAEQETRKAIDVNSGVQDGSTEPPTAPHAETEEHGKPTSTAGPDVDISASEGHLDHPAAAAVSGVLSPVS